MFTFLSSRLAGPIATGVAALLLVALMVQTVRISGFFFIPGLEDQLAACQSVNSRANEAATKAIADAREAGRLQAEAAAKRLLEGELKRREDTDKVIADLQKAVSKLRPVAPPPVILPGQPLPPIVVTPPQLPAVCRLDQAALDSIRGTLNVQRGFK